MRTRTSLENGYLTSIVPECVMTETLINQKEEMYELMKNAYIEEGKRSNTVVAKGQKIKTIRNSL